MIVLNCPNCSASLELDENRKLAFCQYCGCKVLNPANNFEIDNTTEINNLLERALEFEKKCDWKRCEEYCNRILDLDPKNTTARQLEARLPSSTNVSIVYRSELDDKYKLRVSLDGRHWVTLNKNQQYSIKLPVGKHKICFVGKSNGVHDLMITDPCKKITIVYEAARFKSRVTQL